MEPGKVATLPASKYFLTKAAAITVISCCFLLKLSPSSKSTHLLWRLPPPAASLRHLCRWSAAFTMFYFHYLELVCSWRALLTLVPCQHIAGILSCCLRDWSDMIPQYCCPHVPAFAGLCTLVGTVTGYGFRVSPDLWFLLLSPQHKVLQRWVYSSLFRVYQDVYPVSLAIERSHNVAWKTELWAP